MRATALALLLAIAACSSDEPCVEQKSTVEVVPGDVFYDQEQQLVARLQNEGWSCPSEPMRNASGAVIGTRYTCTKCQ